MTGRPMWGNFMMMEVKDETRQILSRACQRKSAINRNKVRESRVLREGVSSREEVGVHPSKDTLRTALFCTPNMLLPTRYVL